MTYEIDYKARYEFMCRASAKDNDAETISASLNQDLHEVANYIRVDLAQLARRGCPDSFADILRNMDMELIRFRQFCEFSSLAQKVVVGVGGKFSAGKSSLINTLLGKKQLITEIDPTTSLPTYLLQGDSDSITALNLFNKRVSLSHDEFQSLTHDEKDKYGSQIGSLLSSAFVSDVEFPWQNLAILDTPGYTKPEDNAHSERTDENIARSQLNAAQFVIWLVSAEDGTIKEDDLQFLATLNNNIPKLILVNKSDKKAPEDIEQIVSLIKKTLANRNLPVLDVIPVSRKKRSYPIEPVTDWFDKWNKTTREVAFAKNFKRQFHLYEQYLENETRQSHRQLDRLNRILALSDDESISEDATNLQVEVRAHLRFLEAIEADLKQIQQLFFAKLKSVGEYVGIDIPELNMLDEIDLGQINLYEILCELREQQGKKSASYSSLFSAFTLPSEVRNLDLLLRRISHKHQSLFESFTNNSTDAEVIGTLLRRDSHRLALGHG
ncbi:dynamin family protein [Psychrobacter sp. TAE2020]|uniref:dynamin family protein n=1 Tax=Psychrobacter sp. TAE2020 TaxID=2846762 RepID=UPI001C116126|nr:dynamin family protein [Psychrobacter sp. TAE2020]MBU5618068.1 dynamin family protein [Psychrobacter sp. TAE2020]